MENFSYRIIDPCGVDKESYITLHRELFRGANIDSVWVDWYHSDVRCSDTRLGNTRTYGLFDDKRLIGIWSVEPKILRNNSNELINVGRCFAVGVSADYRRMGLFVTLSEYAIKCERELGEYEYILGFPQTGRSVIGGHLKAGWEEISFVDIFSVDLTLTDGSCFKNEIETVNSFTNILSFVSTPNSFDEPASYRNLRFLQHPKLQYFCYSLADAYIVLKTYSTFCHVLELRGSNDNVKILLEVAKSVAKRHGLNEINIWNSDIGHYNNVLQNCGFMKGANNGLPITIIAVNIKSNNKFKIDQFNFGMGVEEGY